MIAKHGDDAIASLQPPQDWHHRLDLPWPDILQVAREGYEVWMLCVDTVDVTHQQMAQRTRKGSYVCVGEVDDTIAVEGRRQVVERNSDMLHLQHPEPAGAAVANHKQ